MSDQEFRSTILRRHIEAEEAFVRGDPEPRMGLWSKRDPVTLYGAIGMSESGWEQLSETFNWVPSRFSEVSNFRIDIDQIEVTQDMAYVLWFERFEASVAGRPVEPVTVRVTHIYRREEGEWRIVHRHADNPGHDPRSEESSTRVDSGYARDQAKPIPIVIGPGDGETTTNPLGAPTIFKARSKSTAGALTVWESVAPPGEGPPLHLHVREDEFLYVLEGRLRVQLDEDLHEAPAGSFVLIPKGLPHAWQNTGDRPARFLAAFTPAAAGMERFFEQQARLSGAPGVEEAFKKFASDAGMKMLGPPLAKSAATNTTASLDN